MSASTEICAILQIDNAPTDARFQTLTPRDRDILISALDVVLKWERETGEIINAKSSDTCAVCGGSWSGSV